MITSGIDVGVESTKAVILQDGKIIGQGIGLSGGAARPAAIEAIYEKALAEANIAAADVEKVVSTGKGKYNAGMTDKPVTETVVAAKLAKHVCPDATMVVSIGSDEIIVAVLGEDDKIIEFAINQKCAAGLGRFLKSMTRRLDMTLEEMSALPKANGAIVNDGCIVFAELDALSLLNHGTPAKEVAAALIEAIAVRANSVLDEMTAPNTAKVVLIGGMTKNAAFIRELKERSGIDFIIPENAEFASALGAALVATQ